MLRDLDSSVAPRNVLGILTGALALCRHRIHLEDLAEACEIPVRTIQWRFARAFERGGGDLIGWSISLSTIWMLEVLNWPLKECARRIGFGDTSTLAAYVARHVGQRPRQILASGGFDLLSRRWLTVWAQKPNAQVVLGNPG
jgi:AraC-like DNA-binding protein